MFRTRSQPLAAVALLLSVFALASCGESDQEKATAQVCQARTDISKQVKMLGELTLSLNVLGEAKGGVEAIRADLTKIKDAQPALEPARQQEVQAATKVFEEQVSLLLTQLVSKPSLSTLETQVKQSLPPLAAAFEKALAPVNCS